MSVLVVITIWVSMFGVSQTAKSDLIQLKKQELMSETNRYAEKLNTWMVDEMTLTEGLARDIASLETVTEEEVRRVLLSHFEGRDELLDMYYGTSQGEMWKASAESEIPEGYDPRERGWYKLAKENAGLSVTDPYFDVFTFQMCDTICCPVYKNNQLKGVVGIDISLVTVTEVASSVQYDDGVYSFVIDGAGNYIYHPNEEYMPTEELAIAVSDTIPELKPMLDEQNYDEIVEIKDYLKKMSYVSMASIGDCGWKLGVVIPTQNALVTIDNMNRTTLIIGIVSILFIIIISYLVIGRITKPLAVMKNVTMNLAEGNLQVDIYKTKRADEVGVLQNSIFELTSQIRQMISEANGVLGEISAHHLNVKDMSSYPGDFNVFSSAVNSIKDIMVELIKMIQEASAEVHQSAGQLTLAADNLAESTTTEAVSIDNLQLNLGSITEKIQRSYENSERVQSQLSNLNDEINNGNKEMEDLFTAVSDIETMSADIQNIVGAIDTIAFQTNILALNASVEAARAGDSGKGFAVVAEEVRALAARCAEESAKTAELIEKCIDAVSRARTHADSAVACMDAVVRDSNIISSAFNEISQDNKEQAENSSEIVCEVGKITDMVSANTATAQQTAASTEELNEQAKRMKKIIQDFKL